MLKTKQTDDKLHSSYLTSNFVPEVYLTQAKQWLFNYRNNHDHDIYQHGYVFLFVQLNINQNFYQN
jgi:hypothetical protein